MAKKKNVFRDISTMKTTVVITSLIEREFDVSKQDLKSKTRKRKIVEARHVAMYFLKKLLYSKKISLHNIGYYFGGREHGTVIHAVRTVENLIAVDFKFRDRIKKYETELNKFFTGETKEAVFMKIVELLPDEDKNEWIEEYTKSY